MENNNKQETMKVSVDKGREIVEVKDETYTLLRDFERKQEQFNQLKKEITEFRGALLEKMELGNVKKINDKRLNHFFTYRPSSVSKSYNYEQILIDIAEKHNISDDELKSFKEKNIKQITKRASLVIKERGQK